MNMFSNLIMHICTRITWTFIAEKMKKTKDIQNLMLNHIWFYHFPEKTCQKRLSNFVFFDVGPASAESSGTATPFYQNKTNISDQMSKNKKFNNFFQQVLSEKR